MSRGLSGSGDQSLRDSWGGYESIITLDGDVSSKFIVSDKSGIIANMWAGYTDRLDRLFDNIYQIFVIFSNKLADPLDLGLLKL